MSDTDDIIFVSSKAVRKPGAVRGKADKAFHDRVKVWLHQMVIHYSKHEAVEKAVSELRALLNIDLTIPDGITSLFITHRAESVAWQVAIPLRNMYLDKIPQQNFLRALVWLFERKYPPTQKAYNNQLKATHLQSLRHTYFTPEFQQMISKYQSNLQRELPHNKEHRKALEKYAKTNHSRDATELDKYPPLVRIDLSYDAESQDLVEVTGGPSTNQPLPTTGSQPPTEPILDTESAAPFPEQSTEEVPLPMETESSEEKAESETSPISAPAPAPAPVQARSEILRELSTRYSDKRVRLAEELSIQSTQLHQARVDLDTKESEAVDRYRESLRLLAEEESLEMDGVCKY